MTTKSRLLLITAFVLVYTLASGIVTTGAWFTDSASSGGAIISSGSLDLQVTGGPLQADNLAPGEAYTPMGSFCTKNSGTIDLKFRGLFKVIDTSSSDLLDYLAMKVETLSAGEWTPLLEISSTAPDEGDRIRAYFLVPGQAPWTINKHVLTEDLTPGEETCYRLFVNLNAGTPDSLQGQSLGFVLDLYAVQVNQPGWD
ncbi:MAG TPA: hypothetical protein VFF68_03115 [Anaerolineaceae bacterium]|nr:hypothetical protein [Anaerolineaceae bacterium]